MGEDPTMNPRSPQRRLFALTTCVVLLVSGCSKNPQDLAAQAVASGDKYFEAKKYNEAAIEYKRAVQATPNAGAARYKLAQTYLQLGDSPKAMAEGIRAADLLPDDKAAQIQAATMLVLAGMYEDAKTRALAAVKIDPKDPDAQILLGDALAGLKDMKGALVTMNEAIGLNAQYGLTYINIGRLQIQAGDKAAAEQAFKRAVAVDPKSEPAHLALANFYWSAGNLAGAEVELKEAVSLAPASPLSNRAIATFYVENKQPGKAEDYLKTYLATSKDADAPLALADFYLSINARDKARPLLEGLVGKPEFFVSANTRLATLDYADGHRDLAAKKLEAVLTRDPANYDAGLMKVKLLHDQGKDADALQLVNTVITNNPGSAMAYFAQGVLLEATHAPNDAIVAYQQAAKLDKRMLAAPLAVARLQFAAGQPALAQQYAEQVLAADPAAADARVILGRSLAMQGRTDQAVRELEPLTRQLPTFVSGHNALGMAYALKGNLTGARQEFNTALKLSPKSIDAIAGLTALDLSEHRTADARTRVEAQIKQSPNDATSQVLAAQTYLALGDSAAAESAFRRVLELDGSRLDAYTSLARIYVQQNRLDDALNEFDQRAKRDPKDASARTMIGMIYELKKQPDQARKSYEAALAIDPRTPVAANNLAQHYADTGENLDLALQLAQTAKTGLPDRPEVDDTLGWVYYKKGLAPLAIRSFKLCVAAKPDNPTFLAHLGLAYAQNKDREPARQALKKALGMKADFDGAADARATLAQLGG